jgi:hypothetical protein
MSTICTKLREDVWCRRTVCVCVSGNQKVSHSVGSIQYHVYRFLILKQKRSKLVQTLAKLGLSIKLNGKRCGRERRDIRGREGPGAGVGARAGDGGQGGRPSPAAAHRFAFPRYLLHKISI